MKYAALALTLLMVSNAALASKCPCQHPPRAKSATLKFKMRPSILAMSEDDSGDDAIEDDEEVGEDE